MFSKYVFIDLLPNKVASSWRHTQASHLKKFMENLERVTWFA